MSLQLNQCHGWGNKPLQTVSYIQSVWAHWYAVHRKQRRQRNKGNTPSWQVWKRQQNKIPPVQHGLWTHVHSGDGAIATRSTCKRNVGDKAHATVATVQSRWWLQCQHNKGDMQHWQRCQGQRHVSTRRVVTPNQQGSRRWHQISDRLKHAPPHPPMSEWRDGSIYCHPIESTIKVTIIVE